jgi:TolA-binding protein
MSEEQNKKDETEIEALAEISEPVEEKDQAESVESETANNALAELVDNLTKQLAELQSEVADLKGALSESESKSKTLEKAFEGVDALDESTEEPAPAVSIVETFNAADPAEQRRLWKESKAALLQI